MVWPYLGALAFVLAYGIFQEGGRDFVQWNVCLLALGLVALTYWLRTKRRDLAPPLGRWLAWAVVLAPSYVALQLVPLPIFLLRILSPTRAGLVASLGTIMQPPTVAALSVSPAVTVGYLLNIVACTLTFLLVREIAWRSRQRLPWLAAIPLIGIAAIEAGLAVLQAARGAEVAGTYRSKNHLAGLLEMVLPIAVAYGVTFVGSRHSPRVRSGTRALWACVAFSIGGVVLLGLVYAQSKMGFVAGLCGLLAMGALALMTTLQGPRKWTSVTGLAASCLLVFFFLPTDQFVTSFGALASDDWSEGRWPIWRDSLHLLSAYPLFGSGLGDYGIAFLKHQSAVVDRAFTFAHNDYLQLAAELGAVGFSIFIGLMLIVVAKAIRASKAGHDWNTRVLGWGCTGAIVAIAVHSLADFNMYIPANALLLAWISGIAVCLPVRSVRDEERPGRVLSRRWAIVLGCVLVMYAPASILLATAFRGDLQAERQFCRFGICDTDAVLEAQKQAHGGIVAAVPIPVLLEAVRRDPAAPRRWCDLGEAMSRAGRMEQARNCFSTALALGPDIPPVLLRAAYFYYDVGESERALAQTSRVLEKTATYDNTIFDWYGGKEMPVGEVLGHGLPSAPRASQEYLRYLMRTRRFADAATAWNCLLSHRYVDDRLANEYVDFLYKDHRYEDAARSWALYAADRGNAYLESNWLFNGDFESQPSGSRFDWTMENLNDDVEVELDASVARTGARSLRVRFGGKANVAYSHTFETTFVTPGLYRFQAFVRSQGITTDQGIGFHIFDAEGSSPVDLKTEQVTGTTDWKQIEQIVRVPPETKLLTVQIVRARSWKFDSHIAGTAWIDAVTLARIE
jgi:O-antigen ligase